MQEAQSRVFSGTGTIPELDFSGTSLPECDILAKLPNLVVDDTTEHLTDLNVDFSVVSVDTLNDCRLLQEKKYLESVLQQHEELNLMRGLIEQINEQDNTTLVEECLDFIQKAASMSKGWIKQHRPRSEKASTIMQLLTIIPMKGKEAHTQMMLSRFHALLAKKYKKLIVERNAHSEATKTAIVDPKKK